MHTPESLMDRLCGLFRPVSVKWREWRPADLYLWEQTQATSDLELLEADMRRIGLHFASADNIGARTEFALIAECVMWIRSHHSSVPSSRKQREAEIDTIYQDLTRTKKHEVQPPIDKDLPFESPVCWRIAQAVVRVGRCSQASLEGLIDVYTDIAHMFLLRDGNITPEEDIQLKRFHAAFNG